MQLIITVLLVFIFFSVMEKCFPLHQQKTFRTGWLVDLTHYFINQFVVDIGVYVAAIPLYIIFWWALDSPLQHKIASQPGWIQFLLALFVAELAFYIIHRLAHTLPCLWKFHAIHHSSTQLDWLAALRFHPIEMIIARVFVGLPLVLLGFDAKTFGGYLIFNALNSIFIHANVKFKIPFIFWWIVVSPQYHHWHHAKDIVNKNFGHPLFDLLFGTFYFPREKIPTTYGVDSPVPTSYWGQLRYPWGYKSCRGGGVET